MTAKDIDGREDMKIKASIGGQHLKVIALLVLLSLWVTFLLAQSPQNLNADINASHGFSSVANIEATYNNARHQEEIQLGLPNNSITRLTLPAGWDQLNDEQRMLWLLNDERTSRKGIDYGQGPVKGLAYEGIAMGIDDVADLYASTLFNADAWTHTYNGTTPSSRIGAEYSASCRESIARSENLYVAVNSGNTGFPRAIERAIYGFIYDDAGSAWGHREMCLLQDRDIHGRPWGFTNNSGNNESEGFLGVGVYRGTNYSGIGGNWPYGVMVVMNHIDPSPNCNYNVIYQSTNQAIAAPAPTPCVDDILVNSPITQEVIKTDGAITIGANASFSASTTISSPSITFLPGFELDENSCVQFINDGCAYTGTFNCDENTNTPTAEGTCSDPINLACGDSFSGTNAGQFNQFSYYGSPNNPGWTGGETIYTLTLTPQSSATVTLSNLTADVDLFLTTTCTNSLSFQPSTNTGTNNESLSFSTTSGVTVYLIVDGWQGAQASYTISVSGCSGSVISKEVTTKAIQRVVKHEEVEMKL